MSHSPMALQSPIAAASAATQLQRQAQVFEFTKRKKWADILVSELPDTVLLVLDTDGQIQYVGANANDVLGWEVEELSETDILEIVNDDDKKTFSNHFQKSLSSQQDLSCYARLKCKHSGNTSSEQGASHNELLFEIRGHALYLPNDECKCFFFMAKPYPSRNMAILNTFLELKIENERLTQRLKDLKSQQDVTPISAPPISAPMPPSTMSRPQFSSFEFSDPRDCAVQSPSTSTVGGFNAMQAGFVHSTVPSTNTRDEEDDEGGKKKKLKKNHAPAQQYVCVTCGRTDSPEWRKGPRGPKTLCNACGLRWAKRSKRTDDVPIPYVQGQGAREGQDGARPPPSTSTNSSRAGRGAPVANAALSVTPTEPPSSAGSSGQQQGQQGRFNAQVPTPPPTHTSFSQAQMATLPPPVPPSGHYAAHVPTPMHHQNIQSSPSSAHGFVQPQTQEHYQAAYEHYTWPMNQHREGGYGY